MDNHEFEDLGKKIQDIVDNAVNSNSYHELSHTINQTVNKRSAEKCAEFRV